MIQFCPLKFETKLVIKLNYNLYIHIKIIFNIFINQITPPNYSNYYVGWTSIYKGWLVCHLARYSVFVVIAWLEFVL